MALDRQGFSPKQGVAAKPVTIASIRAHGVRRLLVYCDGNRAGDWPCHHSGTLPIDQFEADEMLKILSGAADATGLQRAALSKAKRQIHYAAHVVSLGARDRISPCVFCGEYGCRDSRVRKSALI